MAWVSIQSGLSGAFRASVLIQPQPRAATADLITSPGTRSYEPGNLNSGLCGP